MATNEFFNINKFREKLGGGSKANLFRMDIIPEFSADDIGFDLKKTSILCKSGAIPAFTLGIIEVPFRGRRIKIPGDRTYGDWTATFVNDDQQNLRKSFDKWMNSIVNVDGQEALRTGISTYRSRISINQLRPDGNISRTYDLYDAFPTDVSAIDLSYDTTDAVQEFTVTFQYHYLDVGGTSTTAGGDASAPPLRSAGAKV